MMTNDNPSSRCTQGIRPLCTHKVVPAGMKARRLPAAVTESTKGEDRYKVCVKAV
jgi:hypothetical protein